MLTPKQIFSLFHFYEEDRVVDLGNQIKMVECRHLEPSGINHAEDILFNRKEVTMIHVKTNSADYYAGKCEVCGKVYVGRKKGGLRV